MTPLHIAVIPDGNRRWAKERNLAPWKGHEAAQNVLRSIGDWAKKNERVSVLTLWLFSTENWKRDPQEIAMLMNMLEKTLEKERPKWKKERTRFLHSGRKDRIPSSLAALLTDLEKETADFTEATVHLALDYGGKDEVVRAVRKIGDGDVTEESIAQALDQPSLPPIDIVIRTSGEVRTSNFALWQTAYSEWFFLEKKFPELTTDDMEQALRDFDERERRFGGSA